MLKYACSSIKSIQRPSRLLGSICYSSDIASNSHSSRLPDEDFHRKRKTEWKRRQKGQSFLDSLIITVRGGKGGDGCVAFHREKFKPYGPPSGGNGGRGGDVYIQACSRLTTLASVPKRVRAASGGHGKGTWMHGRNAPPTLIKVPLGTVVRELDPDDTRATKGEVEDDWRPIPAGGVENELAEEAAKIRQKRWLHYPGAEEDNLGREAFKEAEKMVYRMERERRMLEREEKTGPIFIDLESESQSKPNNNTDSPPSSWTRIPPYDLSFGYLLARGGIGGLGNPTFLSSLPQLHSRSPKFATRGQPGELITLHFELKLLADVGLVGFPNAGKSTLLKALTRGRSKTEVAGYAFTTVNPVVGVVRLGQAGNLLGGADEGEMVVEETKEEEIQLRARQENGEFALMDPPPNGVEPEPEDFRFSVADNPGLIHESSQNRGLGHSFLRSIERALALAYVVDFSGPDPEGELITLKRELETYKTGLSTKSRVVVFNKADLLCDGSNEEGVKEAKEKLGRLTDFVRREMVIEAVDEAGVLRKRELDVVPISAKYSQNIMKLVGLLKVYVEEERQAQCHHQ